MGAPPGHRADPALGGAHPRDPGVGRLRRLAHAYREARRIPRPPGRGDHRRDRLIGPGLVAGNHAFVGPEPVFDSASIVPAPGTLTDEEALRQGVECNANRPSPRHISNGRSRVQDSVLIRLTLARLDRAWPERDDRSGVARWLRQCASARCSWTVFRCNVANGLRHPGPCHAF